MVRLTKEGKESVVQAFMFTLFVLLIGAAVTTILSLLFTIGYFVDTSKFTTNDIYFAYYGMVVWVILITTGAIAATRWLYNHLYKC